MPTTTNSALRYPATGSAPNGPQQIQDLATDVDTKMPRGQLCKPIAPTGSLGASGNGLAVATSPSLTVPANRLITLNATFQLFIPSGNTQIAYVWLERWVGGSLVRQFGGKTIRITTNDAYDIDLEDTEQITSAGAYVWKIAGAMSGAASATVDTSSPTGTVIRTRNFTISDTGPIPAI